MKMISAALCLAVATTGLLSLTGCDETTSKTKTSVTKTTETPDSVKKTTETTEKKVETSKP